MTRHLAVTAVLWLAVLDGCAGQARPPAALRKSTGGPCRVLADERLENPMKTLVEIYGKISGSKVELTLLPASKIEALAGSADANADVLVAMPVKGRKTGRLASLGGAKQIAWTHPKGLPVTAVAVSTHREAGPFIRYAGGPEGHRKWAQANFRVATGKTSAEAYDWIVRHRTMKTYPMTAVRMLRELGGVRDGLCIDVGCGSGLLDVELAKRSNLKIIGLDIDPNVKGLFDKYIRQAGMEKRISIVIGDAQKMPFPDNYADVIVSRGTLTFIPDIGKCLREVQRVMKPTGVAFLGGRYLYTPRKYKISTEKLRRIVGQSGVKNAKVIDMMGQWVKIIGPQAPKAAQKAGTGPHMLVGRVVSNYGIVEGHCLLLGRSDGPLVQALQKGAMEFVPNMKITAVYASEKEVAKAVKRLKAAGLTGRITCKVGKIEALPFEAGSFDLVVGVGPILLFSNRPKAIAELHRVLRGGGVSFVGGKFYGMPKHRRASSDQLRKDAEKAGVKSIRILDSDGQWVEIRKR